MWDTWRIRGGGEGAGFYVRPGFEDDPRLIHDTPNYRGEVLPTNRGECAGGPKGLLDLARNTLTWSDLLTLDGWWVEESGVWAHRTPAVVAGDSRKSTLVTKFRFTGQIETPGPHRKPWSTAT